MLSMMRKCIMVKVGEAKTRKRTKVGGYINFAEIGEKYAIYIIGLGEWTLLGTPEPFNNNCVLKCMGANANQRCRGPDKRN